MHPTLQPGDPHVTDDPIGAGHVDRGGSHDLKPYVTVGLPVCNGERYVAEALRSLLSQTYDPFEIIVSDNKSDDRTQAICETFAAADRRILYTRTDQRLSFVDNWNRVLRLSSGEYFMWAAHDDLWEEEYIESLVNCLEDEPEALVALARFDMIDGEGGVLNAESCRFDDFCVHDLYPRLLGFIASDFLGKGNAVHGLMRRDALIAVDGASAFDEIFTPGDWLLLFRLLKAGPFVYDDRLLFHKRDGYAKGNQSLWRKLKRQASIFRGYLRYGNSLHGEIERIGTLSASQKSDLLRVSRSQVAHLYASQVGVVASSLGRRFVSNASRGGNQRDDELSSGE